MASPNSEPAPDPSPFRDARRELNGVLAPLEERCLIWLARRMPSWVNSDHLTALGFAAMLLAGIAYWFASVFPGALVLVVVCLAVNWFGDSLDGTLARVRNHQRPRYGFYLDHVLDAFGEAAILGGLALSGYISPLVALGVLAAYFLVSIEAYLATHVLGTFVMSFFKLGATELRIILSVGTLVLLVRPSLTILGHSYRLLDIGGVLAIAGLVTVAVTSAVRNARTLYRAESIPR